MSNIKYIKTATQHKFKFCMDVYMVMEIMQLYACVNCCSKLLNLRICSYRNSHKLYFINKYLLYQIIVW